SATTESPPAATASASTIASAIFAPNAGEKPVLVAAPTIFPSDKTAEKHMGSNPSTARRTMRREGGTFRIARSAAPPLKSDLTDEISNSGQIAAGGSASRPSIAAKAER